MRFFISPVLIVILLHLSCNHSSELTEPPDSDNTIRITLKSSQIFDYHTGIYDDEEGVKIIVQAKNFERSYIIRNSDTLWEVVYRYQSLPGFTGSDYVELEVNRGSDGASPPTSVERIKFNIIVN